MRVLPARLAEEVADQCVEDELREEWGLWRVSQGEPIDTTFPMHESRRDEYEAWKRDVKCLWPGRTTSWSSRVPSSAIAPAESVGHPIRTD